MMSRRPHPSDRPSPSPAAAAIAVVVVGVDGSETSRDALWWAFGAAQRLGGRVVATFVSRATETSMVVASAAYAGAICDIAAVEQMANDQAEQLRQQVQREASEHDVDLAFVHAHGDPTKELLRVAADHHADLIVVGRSTKTRHHLAGSLGRRLIGKRDAPVVVIVP